MPIPADFAALRALVEAVTVLRKHLDQYMSRRAARWKWYQDSTRQLDITLSAAQAALERVEHLQADYDALAFNQEQLVQEFDVRTARVARLEEALLNLATYGRKCWCPVGYHPVEVHHQRCRYIRAAQEGRDE